MPLEKIRSEGVAFKSDGRPILVLCCDTTSFEGKAARRLCPGLGWVGEVMAVLSYTIRRTLR